MLSARHFVIGCLILVVIGGVLVVIVVGGIFMLGLNKYGETTEADGMEFGRRTDQQGCQSEGLRRFKAARRAGNPIDAHATQLFTYGCFQTCRPTAGFCRDAPTEDKVLTVRRWAQYRCHIEGESSNDEACIEVLTESADSCLGKTKHHD